MKTLLYILLPLLVLAAGAFILIPTSEAQPEKDLEISKTGHKILIAYFSRKGSNYVSNNIVDLPVGNTAVVAEMIREKTGADLFEIKTVNEYPIDYHETTDVAKAEKNTNARPEIVGSIPNMEQYDIIILGYPNWWGTVPMAVHTFLEKHQIAGKTILPLCTHEGSGMGSSERDLRKALPDCTIKKGLPIKGSRVCGKDPSVPAEVEKWLKENL